MIPLEVGTPYLHRQHLAEEVEMLPESVRLSEGQHVENQMDYAAEPDLVFGGLGSPTRSKDELPKWSIELLFTPIRYEQAGDLANSSRVRSPAHLVGGLDHEADGRTYEGPPHVGAMRIATAMKDVHYAARVQGDTYADLLFTMIERRKRLPPVTYTTFQAATQAAIPRSCSRAPVGRRRPLQTRRDHGRRLPYGGADPSRWPGRALGLDIPVVPLELPAYQRGEPGCCRDLHQMVRTLAGPSAQTGDSSKPARGPETAERNIWPSASVPSP